MRKIIIMFSLFLLVTNCSKYRFNTITETNDIGSRIGNVDDKDWQTDDKWSLSEKNLFDTNYNLGCKINHDFEIIGYPNPFSEVANVSFKKDTFTKVEVVLTNSSLKVISELELNEYEYNAQFLLNDEAPGYYRVYYKLIKAGCEFRGHGDILKME